MALIAVSAFLQHFLGDIYIYTALTSANGVMIPGSDFLDRLISTLHTNGIALIVFTMGIWAIKLNFLSFFRGFGRQIKSYMILWWLSSILVVACGVAQLGVIPYSCLFGSFDSIMMECATRSGSSYIYRVYQALVAFDIVSDAIIICFPVFIVWRTKINLKQKALLTGVFLLVGITITVTILRGCTFTGVGKSPERRDNGTIDIEWMLCSFFIEYTVCELFSLLIDHFSIFLNLRFLHEF
ncbi:hypothetical protein F5883DRAFT_416293 [Diaporthe sp. PMI_573]|nr:hypothetical protein F5883DRAFT_416293 [Diaporthaceae sp. PMI_573]